MKEELETAASAARLSDKLARNKGNARFTYVHKLMANRWKQ